MSYVLNAGDTEPPLRFTATDTAPIDATNGWVLRITRPDGTTLLVTPVVNAANPQAVVLTHQWTAGQTTQVGVWTVEAEATNAGGGVRSFPPTGPIPFIVTPQGAGAYATLEDARAAGAQGTDAEVLTAIRAAEARVDRYTGDRWAPTPMTVAARVGGDRRTVLLGRRVQTVTSVRPVGATTDLPTSAYLVLSSATPGQQDAVVLGATGSDVLIAGAEPWAGGWAGYIDRHAITGQVLITGVFGHGQAPPEVRSATAAIAAWLTSLGGAGVEPSAPQVDDEGNTLTITVTPADEALARSTGVAAADQLLGGLVRRRVRLAG